MHIGDRTHLTQARQVLCPGLHWQPTVHIYLWLTFFFRALFLGIYFFVVDYSFIHEVSTVVAKVECAV